MRLPLRLLSIAIVVAALAAWVAPGSRSSITTPPGTPAPAVAVWVRSVSGSLPPGCRPDEVARLLERFVDAFNRGDLAALARLFPAERAAQTGEITDFQWFSVTGPGDHFLARDREALLAYAAERHARREVLWLLRLEVATSWHGGVDIIFDLVRRADDFPERVVGGKGAIDCARQQIFVWSLGNSPALGDEGAPRATPAAPMR